MSGLTRNRPRRQALPSGLWATAFVVTAWIVVLVVTGSPARDVAYWTLAVVVGVLAPGWVVVRSVRPGSAPLVEDMAWASAAGLLVAVLGWLLDRLLPWSPGPLVVGPAVVAIALLTPLRRRVLARPAPGWGRGPSLALGATLLVALTWMCTTGLMGYRPDPGASGTWYYPDILYQLTLLGELRHHPIPTYPPVDGTSLSYHWFLFAVVAHLLTNTGGIDAFDSTLRLAPATMVPAILLLAAVLARRMSGRVWAGPPAAALLAVVGITVASKWTTEDGSIDVLVRIWRASPPQTFGWLAAIAATGCVFAFLRRSADDAAVPVRLLLPFLLLTAGGKSSQLPLLMAGVGLAGLVALLRREWPLLRRCLLVLVALLSVFGLASVTLYATSSYGVQPQLLGAIRARMSAMFPGEAQRISSDYMTGVDHPKTALLTGTVLFVLPLLPRLVGLLFQARYRPGDPTTWVCIGTAAAGLVLPLAIRHPAGSEIYFLLSAYPIGVIGAASGLALLATRVRSDLSPAARTRMVWCCAGLVLLGALAAAVVAHLQPRFTPPQRWLSDHPGQAPGAGASLYRMALDWLRPTIILWCVLAVLAAGVAITVALVQRSRADAAGSTAVRPAGWAPVTGLATMSLLLGTGLYTMSLSIGGTDNPAQGSRAAVVLSPAQLAARGRAPVTRDIVAAGRLVDERAGPADVVATNLQCAYNQAARQKRNLPCDARNFAASAFTQRRSLVGGWAYADRVVSSASSLNTAYRNAPFWDPALLARQEAAIARPSQSLLADLYRENGVRWVFADLREGPVDTAGLDRLADRRFSGPNAAVWQLRAPS